MRYFILFFLIIFSYPIRNYAQIYSVAKEINFSIIQYDSGKDSSYFDSEMTLICHGDLWKMPLIHKTEENNWSITWKFNDRKGNTGVYENKERIFLHPPRMGIFRILEFCPFPIVYFPLSVSKTWNYKLVGAKPYSNSIKRTYKEEIDEVDSHYTVIKKLSWYSFYLEKSIDCYEIEAIGHTKIGKTKLQAYFSEIYGFVYLHYKTLNNDHFIFTIKSVNYVNNFSPKKSRVWY
jgi:hypothetical protein